MKSITSLVSLTNEIITKDEKKKKNSKQNDGLKDSK